MIVGLICILVCIFGGVGIFGGEYGVYIAGGAAILFLLGCAFTFDPVFGFGMLAFVVWQVWSSFDNGGRR